MCAWWVPWSIMEVHKNWCLEVFFHFSHLKEEQMGSLNQWWCETGFTILSKWVLMQWTLPSSLRATKCKVCQFVGRLWHLYSVLRELAALYSYYDIQKQMWTYAVTCNAECIRLLAGRGMNMSWVMIFEHSIAAPYSLQQTQGVAAVMLLET